MGKSLVLYFHRENDAAMWERIILALKQRYQLVSLPQLEELLLKTEKLNNICHISFDDGDSSFYQIVYPVLIKHQVPVSLFLSPEILVKGVNYWFQEIRDYDEGVMKQLIAKYFSIPMISLKPFSFREIFMCLSFGVMTKLITAYRQELKCGPTLSQNMSLAEALEVDRSGLVTIGAHSIHHPILQNEEDENCLKEIEESIKGLQQLLGHPVRYFAYPNGIPGIDFGEREMKYLKDCGVTLAFSTELDHLSSRVNMLSIPRMGYPRMGLSPGNPLINFRLGMGNNWINIKSFGRLSEKKIRARINLLLGDKRIK